MGMMKGNMAMMIPQTLIMGWINAFFAGFVVRTSSLFSCLCYAFLSGLVGFLRGRIPIVVSSLSKDVRKEAGMRANIRHMITVKLPFPLTLRFKSMLQSGVATRDLDVQWVSSLSWYFLNLFGLQSVFIFILGNENGMSLLRFRQKPPYPVLPLPTCTLALVPPFPYRPQPFRSSSAAFRLGGGVKQESFSEPNGLADGPDEPWRRRHRHVPARPGPGQDVSERGRESGGGGA